VSDRDNPSRSPGWTSLIGSGLSLLLRRRIKLLDDRAYWVRHTAEIQHDALRRLLEKAAETEFGRAHEFGRIARLSADEMLKAYRASVPVTDWYGFKDALARMRDDAEPDVLWPGLVRDFAQTSGTTAGEKYLPVSRDMQRANRRAAFDIFANAHRLGISLPRVLGGHCLYLGGSTSLDVNKHGIRTGDLSAIALSMLRWPISRVVRPSREVALISHWPTKLQAIAEECAGLDVRMITGVPSWVLALFDNARQVLRKTRPDVETVRDMWPNLSLFVHGGVRYEPFAPRIRRAWSGDADQDLPGRLEVYPASEAFVAMQDTRGDPGLRLLVDGGNYFEFVPQTETLEPHAEGFGAHEVELGQRYLVCVSSCAGLYRYVIGDVVVFDTVPRGAPGSPAEHEGPARLRIVGRHKHFMNAFGEHIIVEHIENAVSRAAAETSLVIGEFTAAPFFTGEQGGGIELIVEVEGGAPEPSQIARFGEAFDAAIKSQNQDYTTKRTDNVGMVPPRVRVVPLGAFHRWMESEGKLGGQHKCPRCANDRRYADPVLEAAGLGAETASAGQART